MIALLIVSITVLAIIASVATLADRTFARTHH